MLDHEKRHRIFLNYWIALRNVIQPSESGVFYKYNGVELFCRFAVPFFQKMMNQNDFKIGTMEKVLKAAFDNADGDAAGVGHAAFWNKGGKASFVNSGALTIINAELSKALHTKVGAVEIEV